MSRRGRALCEGVVIVVDVIRAFTTAAFALSEPKPPYRVSRHDGLRRVTPYGYGKAPLPLSKAG